MGLDHEAFMNSTHEERQAKVQFWTLETSENELLYDLIRLCKTCKPNSLHCTGVGGRIEEG